MAIHGYTVYILGSGQANHCNLNKTIQSESMTREKPFLGRGTQVLAEQ